MERSINHAAILEVYLMWTTSELKYCMYENMNIFLPIMIRSPNSLQECGCMQPPTAAV